MPETGRWRGYVFQVSPNMIFGFTGLTVKGSTETEDKTTNGQKYVARKTGKPIESTFTIKLSAQTGCKVRESAMALVQDAKNSEKGYLYIGGKKLVPSQLMLVEAEASEIFISPKGQWISCDVSITMKQCTKDDGSPASSSSSGSQKASVKTKQVTGSGTQRTTETHGDETTEFPGLTIFQKAMDAVSKTVAAAKTASKSSGTGLFTKLKLFNQPK